MGQKKRTEKTAEELQAERVTAALEETDRTGRAPDFIKENPGQFLRDMYDVWHRQGGKEGGRWRNSIRKMREQWLIGRNHVPSLHPKLMGRVKLTRSDVRALVGLFLERWRYGRGDDPLSAMTDDGYVGFTSRSQQRLRDEIVNGLARSKVNGGTLCIPEQRKDLEEFEETKRRWVDVEHTMKESDALITLSRHRITVGRNSVDTMDNFWHLLNHMYKSSNDEDYKDKIFVWVIDIGNRLVEQEFSFDEYFNAGLLALQLHSFGTFDTLNDYQGRSKSTLFPRLRIAESVHREQRRDWLNDRTVIVVQNLRREEFDGLYDDQNSVPEAIRLKDIGVTGEHILPNKTPREWAKQLRSLYGKNIEAADATFTVFLMDPSISVSRQTHDLRYFAHTPISEIRARETGTLPNVALSSRSVELQSPGQDYDDAFRLIYWAARYRLGLGDEEERRESLTALAYVRKHGFRFLRLRDFLRIFAKH